METIPSKTPCTTGGAAYATPIEDTTRPVVLVHAHDYPTLKASARDAVERLTKAAEELYVRRDLRYFFARDHASIGTATTSEYFLRDSNCVHARTWTLGTNLVMVSTFLDSLSGSNVAPHWKTCFDECAKLQLEVQAHIEIHGLTDDDGGNVTAATVKCGEVMAQTHIDNDLGDALRQYKCCRAADAAAVDREFVRVGYYVRDAFLVELQRLGWRGVFLAAMLRLPGVRYFTGDQVGVLMTLRRKAAVREGYMGTLR